MFEKVVEHVDAQIKHCPTCESTNGAYHAFDFSKYVHHYLAAIAYRFNRRFILKALPERLLIATVGTEPRTDVWLRLADNSC